MALRNTIGDAVGELGWASIFAHDTASRAATTPEIVGPRLTVGRFANSIIDEISPRPIVIVAGDYRDFYGAEADIAAGYVTAAGSNADLWIIPGAGPVITPLEYRQKMVSFFEETLILSQ